MATPVDFTKYLQSLVDSYETKYRQFYTLTDLQVEVRVEMPPEDRSQPPFPKNKPETKIERLEVLSGIRKYLRDGNVLLVGKPGSGKSTVLQRFRWELAREALKDGDRPIPVLVELKYDWSILEAICAAFRREKLRVSAEQVDDLLLDDKLLLLLDGVNEMPSQKRRQDLQQFRDGNSGTRMILTTRDLALGGSFGIEKKLEMCALTKPQMEEFVRKHLPQHGDSLLQQLRDRLREIAETPLLLWMMCEVFEPNLKIPQSKGELFQEFDRQYDEFKGCLPVSDDFRRFKSDILQQLAFVMLQGDSQQPTEGLVAIPRDRAVGILKDWLRDEGVLDAPTKAKEWLEDLLEHHLLQVAAKPEEIEFHHQLFQEYYAGRALLKLLVEKHQDVIKDERLKHFYLNYFKWTEPLAFMLSLLGDEVQAVRVVRLALEVDLMLGARLAGEVQREFQQRAVGLVDGLDVPGWLKVELLGEVRSDEAIPGLLKLLEHSDSYARFSAVYVLGAIGSEVAMPGLLKLVEDSDYEVRSSVAYAFGEIASDAAISGLFKLVEDAESDVRKNVADALGEIGSEAVIPGLLKLVEDSDSYVVCGSAVDALGQIGSEAVIPELLKLVEHPEYYVRLCVADALRKICSEAMIPGLIKLVKDPEWIVHHSAVKALKTIGSEAVINGLLNLVKHSESDVRWRAASALSQISCEAGIPGLLKLVEDSDSNVRKSAAYALGNIGSDAVITGLLKLVEDSAWNVYYSVADALKKIGSEAVICGLLKLIEHSVSDIRCRAAYALGRIGSEQAIPGLLKLVEDSDSEVRSSVAQALGEIGSDVAIPGLFKLVEDSDSNVRDSVAYAFWEIGSEQAIPGLFKLVEDSDSNVRWRTADAFGKIGSDLAIPGLFKLVEDSDSNVRSSVAYAFGEIGSDAAILGLLKLVEDSDSDVQKNVADALKKLGCELAIPRSITLVEDSDSDVRKSAVYALEKIGYDAALPELLKLIEYSSYFVRQSAVDALGKIGSETVILGLLKLVEHSDSQVRSSVAVAFGRIGSEAAIPGLLKLLEDSYSYVRNDAVFVLKYMAKKHTEKVVPHLPHILTLISSESRKEVHPLIFAIQATCKYYNYSIRQLPLLPESAKHPVNTSASVYIQSIKEFKLMSNQSPIFNQQNATIGVNYAAENSNPKIIQKIEAAQQSSPEAALNAVVQIIQALEKKYTYVKDEKQALNIIDAEFKEIKEQKPIEWQNLISLKRLYNGSKKAAVKVGEHFTESNPWGKGLVAFIEGVSEDVN